MTTPDDVLGELAARGATLVAEGDVLRVRAADGVISAELRAALAAHKPALLSRLRTEAATGGCLSSGQESLWFLHALEPASLPAYNTVRALRVRGNLRADWLQQALQLTVDRHDALRSFFPVVAGRPVVRIAERLRANVAFVDLSASGGREAALTEWLAEEVGRRFALDVAPLYRVTLVRLAEERSTAARERMLGPPGTCARPRSPTLARFCASNRMLLGFKSRCTTSSA